MDSKGEIVVYTSKESGTTVEVRLNQDTVWLTQAEIAKLFQTERSAITKHLNNIFASKELGEKSNVQKMHIASSDKPVKLYSLDAIISVGYRVNSARATQFRIWATGVLRKHLIEGYTLNEKRLGEQSRKLQALQRAIKLIGKTKARKPLDYQEAMGLLEVINDYNYALGLLDDYDYKRLKISGTSKKGKFVLNYKAAISVVKELRKKFGGSDIFGVERDQSFKSSVASIYQTFGRKELYPSVEEKASNLLYFIVKNHSFIDGNKRIAASVFLWFLKENSLLYKEDGTKRIADNALVALTLMVNLINRNN